MNKIKKKSHQEYLERELNGLNIVQTIICKFLLMTFTGTIIGYAILNLELFFISSLASIFLCLSLTYMEFQSTKLENRLYHTKEI